MMGSSFPILCLTLLTVSYRSGEQDYNLLPTQLVIPFSIFSHPNAATLLQMEHSTSFISGSNILALSVLLKAVTCWEPPSKLVLRFAGALESFQLRPNLFFLLLM